ncbi:response regulator [Pedobacter ginsengiterrae]|uniref:Response regulator n=1 Tax=Pedobacter ginsengiterrae TaxID=871696 RepID=A0ABP7PGP6_9SPHI
MNKKILFLDDDPISLYRYGTDFTDAGYEVRCIEVEEELSSLVESFKPDLIILDIRVGDGDGREICNELKIRLETAHIPIIMLTALSYEDISAVECDADAILGKSPDSENLLLTIKNLLDK